MFKIKGKYSEAKVMIDDVEESCIAQIFDMCNNEAFTNSISIMPDCHSGKGSVVGFTMPVGDKIVPNVVGVDIGCGMLSFNIGNIEIDHEDFDKKIRENIPFGMNINDKKGSYAISELEALCKKIGMDYDYAVKSIATLGGGNHFIEIGKSSNTGDIWVTIHTGSRNLGKKVCEYWQDIAVKKSLNNGETFADGIIRIKREFPKSEWNNEISNLRNNINMKKIRSTGLEYLKDSDLDGYLNDMYVAQNYAKINRQEICSIICKILGNPKIKEVIETIHNFIDPNDKIIRKGSVKSYVRKKFILPFNPAAGLLICEGKSNPEWNFSAPHGAGRILSRSEAKRTITEDMAKESMKNVFSTLIPVDENPLVYKDPVVIEKCIEPTAIILDRIIPIHNMKANDIPSFKLKK